MSEKKRYAFSWKKFATSSPGLTFMGFLLIYGGTGYLIRCDNLRQIWYGVIGILILSLATLISFFIKQRQVANVFNTGIIVQAKIIDMKFSAPGGRLDYRYDFNGIECKSYCNVPRDWLKEHGRVGDIVDVVVDPNKPVEAYIAGALGDLLDDDGLIAAKLTPAELYENSRQEH